MDGGDDGVGRGRSGLADLTEVSEVALAQPAGSCLDVPPELVVPAEDELRCASVLGLDWLELVAELGAVRSTACGGYSPPGESRSTSSGPLGDGARLLAPVNELSVIAVAGVGG
jgi:hypothetical protein